MKKWIRILSLVLILALLPQTVPVQATTLYKFLDYSRIWGGLEYKSYPVECSFASMKFQGKLHYTGNYSIEQINEAAEVILGRMNKTEQDMEAAQALLDQWENAQEFTQEDAWKIAENIAKMLGEDAKVGLAKDVYSFFRDDSDMWNDLVNLATDGSNMALDSIKDKIKRWVIFSVGNSLSMDGAGDMAQLGKELVDFYFDTAPPGTMGASSVPLTDFASEGLSAGRFSVSQQKIVEIIINTIVVSLEQWNADKELWKDRVEATNAAALLRTFYEQVNLYLNDQSPGEANWVITAGGRQKRVFSWFGSQGNVQYISLSLAASKSDQYAGLYVNRTQGLGLPFGTYKGSAAASFTHDLSPFDAAFWNLPIGIFKENWLNDLIAAASILGGAELKTESTTFITRTLKAPELTFTIPGGYSYQYNSTIPATPGNRDVYAVISLSQFQDDLVVKDKHTLSFHQSVGFLQEDKVTGVEAIHMDLSAKVSGSSVSITGDNLQAYLNLAGVEFADVDQNNTNGGSSTDDHIWDSLDQGIWLKVRFGG